VANLCLLLKVYNNEILDFCPIVIQEVDPTYFGNRYLLLKRIFSSPLCSVIRAIMRQHVGYLNVYICYQCKFCDSGCILSNELFISENTKTKKKKNHVSPRKRLTTTNLITPACQYKNRPPTLFGISFPPTIFGTSHTPPSLPTTILMINAVKVFKKTSPNGNINTTHVLKYMYVMTHLRKYLLYDNETMIVFPPSR